MCDPTQSCDKVITKTKQETALLICSSGSVQSSVGYLQCNHMHRLYACASFKKTTTSPCPKIQTHHLSVSRCISIWSRTPIGNVMGHSFRIGGSVLLLLAGVPPEVVAATGGWTSLAFLLYWRRISEILPASTSKTYSSQMISDISSTMNNFRVQQKQQNIPQSLIDNAFDGH